MKEHPILFSGEMVRAILDGRKTQTRRAIKPQPEPEWWPVPNPDLCSGDAMFLAEGRDTSQRVQHRIKCPWRVGDKLWVKETWRPWWDNDPPEGSGLWCVVQYRADMAVKKPNITDESIGFAFTQQCDLAPNVPWRPSIHMPRWASRTMLEVTGVRAERVQEISEADAEAEGCVAHGGEQSSYFTSATDAYRDLWNSINAARGCGWDANQWVWVREFKREVTR